MIFVWLPTNRQDFEPQKWNDEDGIVVGGGSAQMPIAEYRLPCEHEGMSLAELAKHYPPPTHCGEIIPADQELPRQLMPKR